MPADNLTSKVLTLLFTDLEGSTALKAKKGDDTASALIAEHRDHINRLAKDYAGRIIDWAGDGCFLTFERPSAAVRFSLNLVQIHQKEGFVTREIVGKVIHEDAFAKNSLKNWIDAGNESPFAFTLRLYKEDQKLKGMVGVDATNFFMPALTGLPAIPIKLDSFFIDRTEVTNKEYQEFIDSGGYKNPEFWEHEFKQNGSIIKWEDAMKLFVDQTGHQGPSTWELGAYPE